VLPEIAFDVVYRAANEPDDVGGAGGDEEVAAL